MVHSATLSRDIAKLQSTPNPVFSRFGADPESNDGSKFILLPHRLAGSAEITTSAGCFRHDMPALTVWYAYIPA